MQEKEDLQSRLEKLKNLRKEGNDEGDKSKRDRLLEQKQKLLEVKKKQREDLLKNNFIEKEQKPTFI